MVATRNSIPSAQVRWILGKLVEERQRLRREHSDQPTLEANRLSIVYWQAELARSLQQDSRVRR